MNTLFEVTIVLIATIFVFLSVVIDSTTTGTIFAVAVLCLVCYKVFFADKVLNANRLTSKVKKHKGATKKGRRKNR